MSKNYVCNNLKCLNHDTTMIMHCARSISAEDDRPYALVCRRYTPPERGNGIRERPILFSGAMVRAILEGRKTMTRRVVKPVPSDVWGHGVVTDTRSTKFGKFCVHMRVEFCGDVHVDCPYGAPGDRLWVRETFRIESVGTHVPVKIPYEDVGIVYAADGEKRNIHREYPSALSRTCHNNKPSIHMPRWASRITLEVTGARVERLCEITEADAVAEGCESTCRRFGGCKNQTNANPGKCPEGCNCFNARENFAGLWDGINGRESWDANPWVWVVEFKRVEK